MPFSISVGFFYINKRFFVLNVPQRLRIPSRHNVNKDKTLDHKRNIHITVALNIIFSRIIFTFDKEILLRKKLAYELDTQIF